MGGLTHQRQARADKGFSDLCLERLLRARTNEVQLSEYAARGGVKLPVKQVFFTSRQRLGFARRQRPNKRRPAGFWQGQEGKRPVGQKNLPRDLAMWRGKANFRCERRALIIMVHTRNAGALPPY